MPKQMDMERRPFPWRCTECGRNEVHGATIDYAAPMKHDGRTYDVRVAELDAARCRNCGALVFDDYVGEQMARALRQTLNLLTPDQIRSAIVALKTTQKDLAASLGIAPETLSRWCTGALIQSKSNDKLLRGYFSSSEVRGVFDYIGHHPEQGSQVAYTPSSIDATSLTDLGMDTRNGTSRYETTRELIQTAGTTWGKDVAA